MTTVLQNRKNNGWSIKQNLGSILEDLQDPLVICDVEGNVLLSNSAGAILVGMSLDELLKSNLKELVKKGYYDKTYWGSAMKAKCAVGGPFLTKRNFIIQSLATPILHEDGMVKLIINSGWVKTPERESPNSRYSNHNDQRLRELNYLKSRVFDTEDIVAESLVMRQALLNANTVAPVDCTTVLYGESGTGKEVFAKYIHRHSRRSQGPFVAVNCAALPEHLIESELFGYESGAFSGANREGKIGLFEAAHRGTLFLDEIGEFPLSLQAKLLRTLESGEIRRLGSTKTCKVDFRLIAATHRNLNEMAKKGLFRPDLFYRLNVVPIKIPPLRERREDVRLLVQHFLAEFERKYGKSAFIGPDILTYFEKHNWPGNARELRNEVEKLVVMSGQKDLSIYLEESKNAHHRFFQPIPIQGGLKEARQNFEEQYIISALKDCGGRLGEAANQLGVSRMLLYRKLKALEEKGVVNYTDLLTYIKPHPPLKE